MIPVGQLPVNPQFQSVYPSLVLGLALFARKFRVKNKDGYSNFGRLEFLSLFLGISFFTISTLLVNDLSQSAFIYFVSLTLMFYLLPSLNLVSSERKIMENSLILVIWICSVYSIVEFILKRNFLMESLYAAGNNPVLPYFWSTYRATSFMGHPIILSLIMSISSLYFFSKYLSQGDKKSLITFLLSAISCTLTITRFSFTLLVVFLVFSYLQVSVRKFDLIDRKKTDEPAKYVLFKSIALILVCFPLLTQVFQNFSLRNNSLEGISSGQVRIIALGKVMEQDLVTPLGKSTGKVLDLYTSANGVGLGLDNSVALLLVNLGIIGTLVFLIQFLVLIQRKPYPGLSRIPLIAFPLAMFFSSYFDGNRNMHAFFALMILLITKSQRDFLPNDLLSLTKAIPKST